MPKWDQFLAPLSLFFTVHVIQIRGIQSDYSGNHTDWHHVSRAARCDGIHTQDLRLPLSALTGSGGNDLIS